MFTTNGWGHGIVELSIPVPGLSDSSISGVGIDVCSQTANNPEFKTDAKEMRKLVGTVDIEIISLEHAPIVASRFDHVSSR